MRMEFPDGQWAEIRERITHAQDKEIGKLTAKAKADPAVWYDVDTLNIRTFVKDWYVNDVDGKPIPIGDSDAVERLPSDIADEIAVKAAQIYTGVTVPNEPTPNSSDD